VADLRGYLSSMIEPGCSYSHGCYADGHNSDADFIMAVSSDYDRLTSVSEIRRGYCRTLRGRLHFTTKKGRGASPVTWTEW